MLSIGEFSKICQVSTKTLRYYAEIGLILPSEINPESGYRYYAVEQLETMLFINRLKSYHFSLEEIKNVLAAEEGPEEKLYTALVRKRTEMRIQAEEIENRLAQLDSDIVSLKQGRPIMSYLNDIEVRLVELPPMNLLSIRKMVHEHEMADEYLRCFGSLYSRIQQEKLTSAAPPMVLFHSDEFSEFGLDTEFAFAVEEYASGTRTFKPGLSLKTVVTGSYTSLSSVYAKQMKWAEENGYAGTDALFEIYVKGMADVSGEDELVTEVYFPVRKI